MSKRMVNIWEPQAIIWLILEWRTRYGKWPGFNDWVKAEAGWPQSHTVANLFGSWSEALRQAKEEHSLTVYRERGW